MRNIKKIKQLSFQADKLVSGKWIVGLFKPRLNYPLTLLNRINAVNQDDVKLIKVSAKDLKTIVDKVSEA